MMMYHDIGLAVQSLMYQQKVIYNKITVCSKTAFAFLSLCNYFCHFRDMSDKSAGSNCYNNDLFKEKNPH